MKVIFELRKEKITSNGLIPIQFVVRAEGVRIRKNVGVSTKEKHWTGARLKPNLKTEESNDYKLINDKLNKVQSKVDEIFLHFRANKIQFSKVKFLERFNSDNEKIISELDFFDCFEEYILIGSMSKAYNTIKSQKTIKGYLSDFQKQTGFRINFDKIDDVFYEELMKYSFFDKKIKNNYFAKIIAVLKSFLRWCTDKGYNKHREYEKFKGIEQRR